MVVLTTTYPYSLEYLCDTGTDSIAFLRKSVIPLAWWRIGSVEEILSLPLGLINRLNLALDNEEMAKKFREFRGDIFK